MRYPIVDESGKVYKEEKLNFLSGIGAGAGTAIAGVAGGLGGLIAGERGAHHAREAGALARRHDIDKMREQNQFNAGESATTRRWQGQEAEIARKFAHDEAGWSRTFARRESQRDRDFQERMSSTAMQRKMEDLKKAGLNPMLAMGAAPGASTPKGSTASSSMASAPGAPSGSTARAGSGGGPGITNEGDLHQKGIQAAVTSAISAMRMTKDFEKADATIGKIKEERDLVNVNRQIKTMETWIKGAEKRILEAKELSEKEKNEAINKEKAEFAKLKTEVWKVLNGYISEVKDAGTQLGRSIKDVKAKPIIQRLIKKVRKEIRIFDDLMRTVE